MHLEQQRVSDDFRLLHMRDLAPEEFVSWLLEWGACALRARQASTAGKPERVPDPKIKFSNTSTSISRQGCFATHYRHEAESNLHPLHHIQ